MVKLKSHKKILDLIRIKKHTLHAAIQEHINERVESGQESSATISTLKVWLKRFKQFIFQFDSRNFALNNNGFAKHYINFLQEYGYANKSIRLHFDLLISILNRLGIPHDINGKELFRGWAKQSKANEDFFLTDDEVKALMQLDLDDEKERVVIDRFVVSCFTGCRISEIKTLSVIDETTLKYTSTKTKKDIIVPFSEPVKPTFNRGEWRKEMDKFTEGNQNLILHAVLERLGWSDTVTTYDLYGKRKVSRSIPRHKAITFHSGRKFFGKMLLDRGVPMFAVSQMMGHENINVTQEYYAALNKEKMVNETNQVINSF